MTVQTSRELAEQLHNLFVMQAGYPLPLSGNDVSEDNLAEVVALLDAYVQVREATAELRTHLATCNICFREAECGARHKYESALTAARKQLEETK
jgi:hypothetical protein